MKNRNFVNLNINPCKMCMPMGAVLAFKGIENSMVILHGSQGCSTYIRRHMAGHYNEPVDIASSSLNEEGTVYGGEQNLKKGLRNIIKLYNPEVIGVATTCLAETIGEDIKRITTEFILEDPSVKTAIIPVSTPGYGGTQFEGYYSTLCCIIRAAAQKIKPNGKINIICGCMSPGDVRNLKSMIDSFGIDYILLPDISNTLDSPFVKEYRRVPDGGTRLADIAKMSGAEATIEMGLTIPENLSPGKFLLEEFGIPLYRCPLPIGIQNTDLLINLLSTLSGRAIPVKLREERGRLIDGMIDSHKYNAKGRAVIYGEPELCYAVSVLCLENGIKPVLVSTGSQNSELSRLLKQISKDEQFVIIDDTDFETIQKYSVEQKANILIGNSDGKIITEKEGIPLVRIGFPIHDRIGGQRLVYTGYEGSQKLLDYITNTLLENKYEKYRASMLGKYYREDPKSGTIALETNKRSAVLDMKTRDHPCYSGGACNNARMHIPVAPACNITCNYCNRKYDCVNESRPGVTSEVLTPEEAAEKFVAVRERLSNLKVVGIAGPGDALANFDKTKRSIKLIKEIDNNITFCLSTNGLMLPYYADEIIKLGVTHVTVTINAVDPEIASKIYREVNIMGKKLVGIDGAQLLIRNQLKGLSYLASKGVVCKVNIVMIKDINDHHIEEVVNKVKECGAFITNIMPLIPAEGSAFQHIKQTTQKELGEIRQKCGQVLKQMLHCQQCRADAIGTLGEDCSSEFRTKPCSSKAVEKQSIAGYSHTFAVASASGVLVDRHFGQVEEFYIYRYSSSGIEFLGKRQVPKYCSGADECNDEESKINRTLSVIGDCNIVLALRIGHSPMKLLEQRDIKFFQTCGRIIDSIKNTVEHMDQPNATGDGSCLSHF